MSEEVKEEISVSSIRRILSHYKPIGVELEVRHISGNIYRALFIGNTRNVFLFTYVKHGLALGAPTVEGIKNYIKSCGVLLDYSEVEPIVKEKIVEKEVPVAVEGEHNSDYVNELQKHNVSLRKSLDIIENLVQEIS